MLVTPKRTGNTKCAGARPFCAYLRTNIALNGLDNVMVHRVAISDSASPALAFYEAPPEKFGMGSLAHQFHDSPTMVLAQTLDELLDKDARARVHVLKIDVEGFEAAVLRGASQLPEKSPPPLVVFEFMEWAEGRKDPSEIGAAQRYLRDLKYKVWRLEHWGQGKQPLTNILTNSAAMLVAQRQAGTR